MSTPSTWAALLEDQAAHYAATGTAPALAALRCRALAAVADQLGHLTPEQTTPAGLLTALEALPAGALLSTHRPPPSTARTP